VAAHPADVVPLSVYVMVATGVAVTLAPVEALNEVLGDHVYVPPAPAPLAFNVVGFPEHIVGDVAEAVNVGVGFTVTTTV
jgi:hypothetical protein